jgi:hypothetical protein
LLPVAYVVAVFGPALSTAAAVREVRENEPLFFDARDRIPAAAKEGARAQAIRDADVALRRLVLAPLGEALRRDPGNVALVEAQLRRHGDWWDLCLARGNPNPKAAEVVETVVARVDALARRAEELDPRGLGWREAAFDAYLHFLANYRPPGSERLPVTVTRLLRSAEATLEGMVRLDPPRETRLRYRLLAEEIRYRRDDRLPAIKRVLLLDRDAAGPRGRLTDTERKQVVRWSGIESKELLEEWLNQS